VIERPMDELPRYAKSESIALGLMLEELNIAEAE